LSQGCLRVKLHSMTRWRLVVLIFELTLFAIILILPQVDLPDFTFCGGTAPVAARARLSSSTVRIAIEVAPQLPRPCQMTEACDGITDVPAPVTLGSRLSRLCVLIC
jgi:hypothetical protein